MHHLLKRHQELKPSNSLGNVPSATHARYAKANLKKTKWFFVKCVTNQNISTVSGLHYWRFHRSAGIAMIAYIVWVVKLSYLLYHNIQKDCGSLKYGVARSKVQNAAVCAKSAINNSSRVIFALFVIRLMIAIARTTLSVVTHAKIGSTPHVMELAMKLCRI